LQRKATTSVKPNIYSGERLKHQLYTILKNLQRKEDSKPPMSKILKRVDKGNERTK